MVVVFGEDLFGFFRLFVFLLLLEVFRWLLFVFFLFGGYGFTRCDGICDFLLLESLVEDLFFEQLLVGVGEDCGSALFRQAFHLLVFFLLVEGSEEAFVFSEGFDLFPGDEGVFGALRFEDGVSVPLGVGFLGDLVEADDQRVDLRQGVEVEVFFLLGLH